MNIKLIKKEQDIISSDYEFAVVGADKSFDNALMKAGDGIAKINVIEHAPVCPERTSFSQYELMKEIGINPVEDDAGKKRISRKIDRLFNLIDVDSDLLKDDKGKWFLTEDEKCEMLEFLRDEDVEKCLVNSFLDDKDRPDYKARKDEKKRADDFAEYTKRQEGKELLSKYIRMLWRMYWIRGYMKDESIKIKFMYLPLSLDQRYEMIRMELLERINDFIRSCIDDTKSDMPIFDREKWLEKVNDELTAGVNQWKKTYETMNSIHNADPDSYGDHLVDKSLLLDKAISMCCNDEC